MRWTRFVVAFGFFCIGLTLLTPPAANSTEQSPHQGVETYPAPAGVPASPDYRLVASGKEVFVLKTPAFSCGGFAFSGDVDIALTANSPVQKVVVRPLALGIKHNVEGNTIRFRLNRPCHLSVEINDDLKRPLFLFADAPEADPPQPGDPNVLYFEGGKVHEAGEIKLRDGQTVYLAGGSVVRGMIRADRVQGARVRGRGILDATTRDTKMQMISLTNCRQIELDGLTVLGSYGWTIVPQQSEDIRLHDVKVLSWRDNDDGLDIVSSRRVVVEHCFFRTKDDCIAVKAFGDSLAYADLVTSLAQGSTQSKDARPNDGLHPSDVCGVRVEDSVFWNAEWGNALEIGFELRTPTVRDIVFRNCDVIREQGGAAISIHNGDSAVVENVSFENIRVEDARGKFLDLRVGLSIYSADCPQEFSRRNPQRKAPLGGGPWLQLTEEQQALHAKQRGAIRHVRFDNIQITAPLPPSIIRGFGEGHAISDISFNNVTCQGCVLTNAAEAHLTVDQASDVRFSK